MKRVIAEQNSGFPRVTAREFDGAFHALRPGVAEEDPRQITARISARQARQPFRHQSGQQGTIHAHQVRHLAREHLLQNRAHSRMIAPQREYPPTGQQIQIAVSFGIEQPRSFPPHILLVEPDRAQHFHERRIDIAFVQFVLTALLGVQPREKTLIHTPIVHRLTIPSQGCGSRTRRRGRFLPTPAGPSVFDILPVNREGKMKLLPILAVAALATTAALAQNAQKTPLKVGDEAPDFTVAANQASNHVAVKLSDFRGKKNVILAFFPAAFTGG